MANIRKHQRIVNTFTGPVERVVLHWLAAHLPGWVTPDVLTTIGVLGAIVIFSGYWLTSIDYRFLWLASLGFVINWFGDSLDGTVARYRHIERPAYGFYIDHSVDSYMTVMIFIGLGLSPFVRFDLAMLALVGYLVLSILVYIRTAVRGEFTISYGKLGPTEARMLAIAANTLVLFIGNPSMKLWGLSLTIYDWIVICLVILLFTISLGTTIVQARALAEHDSKRLHQRQKSASPSPAAGAIPKNHE